MIQRFRKRCVAVAHCDPEFERLGSVFEEKFSLIVRRGLEVFRDSASNIDSREYNY